MQQKTLKNQRCAMMIKNLIECDKILEILTIFDGRSVV